MKNLSIITINLNNKAGLERTIQSVAKQSFTDFEFIIIDGGSTDGSVDVIKQNISIISQWSSQSDNGVYHAMNKGIKQASGLFCLFLNSGDYLYENTILEKIFETQANADIIYGDSMNGAIYCRYPEKLTPLYLFRKPILHQATLIKRSLFETIGLYNESYKMVADWEFFLKAIIGHKCSYVYIPNIPFVYFDMDGMTNRNIIALQEEKQNLLKDFFAENYDNYSTYSNMWDDLIASKQLYNQIKHIPNSLDYKIGHTILAPLRAIKKMIKK